MPHRMTDDGPPAMPPDLHRGRVLFGGFVAIYASALAVLYALGLFGFVWKSLIIPSFFVIAHLAGRFRAFVRDWAVYLGAIVLFDSCRGLIYGFIRQWDLPVYMGYAIDAERMLFGDPIPSIALQQALFADGRIAALERLLVAVHASHFIMFLGFGLLVWLVRAREFPRLKFAFVLVMFVGIAGYLLVPTVPPWMAAERFHVLSGITHMSSEIYNVSLPRLTASFDLNQVAAMPSLHAAFPTLLALLGFRLFERWGFLLLAYFGVVTFGIVYMGEHYIVDVVAGMALAVLAYLAAYHYRPLASRLDREGHASADPAPAWSGALRQPLVVGALLLAVAGVFGFGAHVSQGPFLPDEAFIRRELDGKSPVASLYRALRAHAEGDHRRAQPLFEEAIREAPDEATQTRAMTLLGESAFHNRDYVLVVAMLGPQDELSPEMVGMLAVARRALDAR
jgi:membrane-associated phospholipid phosphatase